MPARIHLTTSSNPGGALTNEILRNLSAEPYAGGRSLGRVASLPDSAAGERRFWRIAMKWIALVFVALLPAVCEAQCPGGVCRYRQRTVIRRPVYTAPIVVAPAPVVEHIAAPTEHEVDADVPADHVPAPAPKIDTSVRYVAPVVVPATRQVVRQRTVVRRSWRPLWWLRR